MSLIQDLVEWASSGDVSPAYDDAKKALGWLVGEPPSAPSWNEVELARDRMINRVKKISMSKGSGPPAQTPAGLCSEQIFGFDWSNVSNAYNNHTLPEEVQDACVCWDSTTETPFILALLTDGTIEKVSGCWDYESAISHEAIEPTYAATPDDVHALCCDGTNVYIAWSTDAGNIRISAHALSDLEGAAAWTLDTTKAYDAAYSERIRLIYCTGGHVAMKVPTGAMDSKSDVYIATSAGALVGHGNGSWITGHGDSCDSRARLVYAAGHVWIIQYQSGTTRYYHLISFKVTSPSTSDFATLDLGDFDQDETWTHPKALVWVNNGFTIMNGKGEIQLYEPVGPVYNEVFGVVDIDPAPNFEGNQDVLLTHDGQNVWALLGHTSTGPVFIERHVAYKIPAGGLKSIGVEPTSMSLARGAVVIESQANDAAIEETDIGGRLLFDGMDVWCILRSGMVFRITNPGGR